MNQNRGIGKSRFNRK